MNAPGAARSSASMTTSAGSLSQNGSESPVSHALQGITRDGGRWRSRAGRYYRRRKQPGRPLPGPRPPPPRAPPPPLPPTPVMTTTVKPGPARGEYEAARGTERGIRATRDRTDPTGRTNTPGGLEGRTRTHTYRTLGRLRETTDIDAPRPLNP